MKDSASYDNASNGGSNLPLDDFFTALRRGGIGVTPAQMAEANQLLLQYAPLVTNEVALCQYLCPLFATNQAEQERFKEIFAAHFLPIAQQGDPLPPPPPPPRAWWKYLLILLPILLLIGWWIWKDNGPSPNNQLAVGFYINKLYDSTQSDDGLNQYITGDTLLASVTANGSDTALANRVRLKPAYLWGDHTPPDTAGRHVYKAAGVYKAQALVKIYETDGSFVTDTIDNYVKICDFPNGLTITSTAKNDSIPVGKPLYFNAVVAGDVLPDSIVWNIYNDSKIDTSSELSQRSLYTGNERLGWELKTEGSYSVYCTIIYGNADGPCTFTRSVTIQAYDPNKSKTVATLRPSANAKSLKPQYSVKTIWFWIFGGGVLFFMWLSHFLRNRYRRLQRAQQTKPIGDADYEAWLATLGSTQAPANIPFLNKNTLVPPEPAMAMVGRLMRRRIAGEAMYMHLLKTISKAVRSNGFFKPVMEPRTQQSEYLLLIEESHINSQQTQLFDYLANTLHRYNVLVEKFYYRYAPSLCYNSAVPNGISLEKLSEKYPHHVLVIAGHGHQLVYPYQPMVSTEYQNVLARWTHKAILTPVPFADWGMAEKNILPTVIPVFPADTMGHLLMMQYMSDDRINVQQQLKEQQDGLYAITDMDFKDVDELAAYCQLADWANIKTDSPYSNLLFQWIAALAVYPKLQWELTLTIGKALLDKERLGHQLNYTNLLRMARISWMNEGIMPPDLRLELLKRLEQENEVLAREAILLALNEIPSSELKPGHAAYEEKETQRIINEFNLYAYDPIKYAAYQGSQSFFERLWNDKKLTEAPVKKYLRNPDAHWPTLINNKLAASSAEANYVPLEDYFKPLPPLKQGLANLYKTLGLLSVLLIGVAMLGLLAMIALQLANTKRFPSFTEQKSLLRKVDFTVKDSATDKSKKSIVIKVGDLYDQFFEEGKLVLSLSDSTKLVAVAVNGEPAFDSSMVVDKDKYEIVIRDKPKETAPPLLLSIFANPDCSKSEDGDRLGTAIQSLDSNIWQNIRLLTTEDIKPSGSCFSEFRVGRGVDEKLVTALLNQFRQAGVSLTIRPGGISLAGNANVNNNAGIYAFRPIRSKLNDKSVVFNIAAGDTVYYPKDGEIIISGSTDAVLAPNPQSVNTLKPVVYIQVSNASMVASAEKFRKELLTKGYTVNPVEVTQRSYNSEIFYYDKAMANSAAVIKELYSRYFPALPLQPKLRTANDPQPNDNRIVVWMQQPQTGGGQPIGTQTGVGQPQDGNGQTTANIGQRIVKIALGEIGTGETPSGSNQTKYGAWYNPQLNAAGKLPWSAAFVAWVYNQAGMGINIEKGVNGFASFANLLLYARNSQWLTNNPQPGDIVVIDLATTSYHGGIFLRWVDEQSGIFETIEGNISIGKDKNGYVGKGTRNRKNLKVYFIQMPGTQALRAN